MKKVLKIDKCYLLIYRRILQKLVQKKSRVSLWMRFEVKKFSVLIDESRDVSIKEHMAVILRSVVAFSYLSFYLYFYNYTNTY